ncbi:MAG: hypothetical protein SFZ02_11940 [bacterium]|nr:hypothetical protein [bacterium]
MRYLLRICFMVCLLIIAFIPTYHTQAATFDVCTLTELENAITTANSNGQADIINFNCSATLIFTSELPIEVDGGNSLTINANGNTVIFDETGDNNRFFRVNLGASFNLNGLTLQNGNASTGGAIFIDTSTTVSISNSTFINNAVSVSVGGAIVNNGSLIISNSTFTGNTAVTWGGGIYSNIATTTTITNSTFTDNSAEFGGAIDNFGNLTITQSTLADNIATNSGSAIRNFGSASSQNTAYQNNTCTENVITDNGGNTINNATGCPGTVVISPVLPPAPMIITAPVLGCALDTTDGVDVANAPDNTYCRVLMKNGGVVSYSGAVPADLISLGVIVAVDVYRLEGGRTVNTFPDYARICLSGEGRFFYMDGRNAPRVSVEMPSEIVDGMTCAWIPAPGTVILTN